MRRVSTPSARAAGLIYLYRGPKTVYRNGPLHAYLQQFVYGVEEPVAHHQAGTWGLPDEPVEELDLANGPQARFVSALERVLVLPQHADYRTPWERGEDAALVGYELDMIRCSAANMRALGMMGETA